MQIPEYIRATSMVFCIIIMCLGVIGNIMVPIVILKTKDMRNSTNIFLTNLSIADLLVLLICTPTVLVEVNSPPEVWVLGEEMCKAVPFVELTVAHASVLTILAISFERYYAICEPLKAGYVCTKTRALMICLAAWTVAAILTSPILLFAEYSVEEYPDGRRAAVCLTKASTMGAVTFFLMTISLFFLLPLIILVVLYAIIAKNLIASNNSRMKIRLSKPELSYKARKQVVLMLGAVVLAFFACLLPFRMLTLWIIMVSEETFQKLAVEKYYNLLYFSRIMIYLNSAVNPILYNLMSSKFRKGFLRLCKCSRLCSQSGRRGGKVRGRSATFTTTTTSSYLTSSSIRNNSEKYTLSLDDLRFHTLRKDQSNGILATSKTPKPSTDKSEEAGSTSDEDEPFQLSRFYRMNLLRLYSTPLLVYDEDRQSAVPFPAEIDNNQSLEGGAFKRQIGVTFKEANFDDSGSIERSPEGRAVRSDLPNPCKLKSSQKQQQQQWHGGGKISLSPRQTKQMSLDESLLTRSHHCPTKAGITPNNV
ncbi:growth hormone secretagogue receptor type 1 isoform X1 [Toxorhynchites rutilus septentrionalis]|uniref:growth hormone secretagogue receptor type 1 isoform X1 n=1 Tax=Toxorhynchites rutilus septentrionalis TaxID=329112 RepID=UPI00247A1FD9|nr:growth hormone secretagogue receptor type 1 isoform X1 [Toxorhynchites rutilus septentrionalis]